MDWRGRLETLTALAMLPVGVAMAFVYTIAFVAVLLLLFVSIAIMTEASWICYALWSAATSVIAARNIVGAIETLNGLDWRPFMLTLLWSSVALATFPGWWLS